MVELYIRDLGFSDIYWILLSTKDMYVYPYPCHCVLITVPSTCVNTQGHARFDGLCHSCNVWHVGDSKHDLLDHS